MRRFLRPAKFVALGLLALLAISLISGAIINWRASARLEEKIAELRAAGEPVTVAELARPAISPETNAATYLRRARPAIEAIEKEFLAAPDADQDSLGAGPVTDKMKKIARDAFDGQPGLFDLLRQAAACPDYDCQFDYTLEPDALIESMLVDVQECRGVTRVLSYHGALMRAEGQPAEAFRDAITSLELCRHYDRNPMLVGYLVSLACRGVAMRDAHAVLATGKLPASAYGELERELARHDLVPVYRHALSTDRAYGLQSIHAIKVYLIPWPLGTLLDESKYIDAFTAAIREADDKAADPSTPSTSDRLLKEGGPVTELLTPALNATRDSTIRVTASLRALRVLNALTRYASAGGEGVPALSELGLPAGVTTDPYNGQPLVVKKLPQGWLVYSVGRDFKDGGGEKLDGQVDEDCGWGPTQPDKPSDAPAK